MKFKIFSKEQRDARAQEFGRIITGWRKEVGLTQVQLAEALDVTQGFIQAIESGRKRVPLDRMQAYATAISKPPDEIYESHIRGHDPEVYEFLLQCFDAHSGETGA